MQADSGHDFGRLVRPKALPDAEVPLRAAHRHRRRHVHVQGQGRSRTQARGQGEGRGGLRHLQLHRNRRAPSPPFSLAVRHLKNYRIFSFLVCFNAIIKF